MTDGRAPAPREPLPPREPRSFLTHVLVDGVVAGALVFITVIILGGKWQLVVVIAVIAGLVAAPFTRRLEARQLAERAARHADPEDTGGRAEG